MLNLANMSCQSWDLLFSFGGVLGGVTSDMTLQCKLTVYYSNHSEIKENSHLFLKNPKWLPNTSHNIYPIMHLWGIDLPVDLLIWNWNCHSWPLDVRLGLGGGRSATWSANVHSLTSILHVKLGKYELSELKSFILTWGCYIWHDSTVQTDCLLLKLFRNKRKFPPFLEESKMAAKYIP